MKSIDKITPKTALIIFVGVLVFVLMLLDGIEENRRVSVADEHVPSDQIRFNEQIDELQAALNRATKNDNDVLFRTTVETSEEFLSSLSGETVSNWVGKWQSGRSDRIQLETNHLALVIECTHGSFLFITTGNDCQISSEAFEDLVGRGRRGKILRFTGIVQDTSYWRIGSDGEKPMIFVIPSKAEWVVLPVD